MDSTVLTAALCLVFQGLQVLGVCGTYFNLGLEYLAQLSGSVSQV